VNILTFDIEEWFHLLDNESTRTVHDWARYESRIHVNMERIFSLLERTNCKATFFCLGWIAETSPDVIKEIVNRGYEVGTHTRMHQLVYEQTPAGFEKDLDHSVKTLEDLTGRKVRYFRAPGFSIREDNKWAFEILAQQGIEVDCSIFPASRAHGGFPSYGAPVPSVLQYQGIRLKELPVNFSTLFGRPIIFSGGGYFRLFPYQLIENWTSQSCYVMSYLHPRDFDPEQPMIKDLSIARRFKAYIGLDGAMSKLEQWITDFEFIDIGTAIQIIDWEKAPLVDLG
jgi:polysaccharide deacetylase family protein (PEP-CTERM system associated)